MSRVATSTQCCINVNVDRVLFDINLSFQLCWGLKLYSTSTWALITARSIMGLGVSGSYVVTPLYIKEISEDSIRGTLGSLVVLSQNLGNLLVYVMGAYLSYDTVLWICLAVPLLHLLVFTSMPETPSYMLKIGKTEVRKVFNSKLKMISELRGHDSYLLTILSRAF